MTQVQTQVLHRTPAETAKEFEDAGVIDARELRKILNAIKLIKENGGWSEITLVYKACDLNDINVYLTQKIEKSTKDV